MESWCKKNVRTFTLVIIKMLPEQITKHWDTIRFTLERSIPPVTYQSPETMNRILESALIGSIQVWAIFDSEEIVGILTTTLTIDGPSQVKNLIVYSLFGFKKISDKVWESCYEGLRKYASDNACHRMGAYTSSSSVMDLVKRLGGDTSYHFVTVEV